MKNLTDLNKKAFKFNKAALKVTELKAIKGGVLKETAINETEMD